MQANLNSDTSKKKSLLRGGVVLTFFGIFAKFIGMFYRIPLTNILGAKGMGVYQMIFPVYALLVSVTSTAVPILVSRNMNALEDDRLKKGFFTETLKHSLLAGAFFGLMLIVGAKLLGFLQGNDSVEYGYYIIAPAVFFVSVLSAFRGWFNASLNTLHTALTSVFEQAFKLSGILAAYLVKATGFAAVMIALSGIVLSELIACVYALILFFVKGGRFERGIIKIPVSAFLGASIPLTIGGLVFPIALFADSILVVRFLELSGMEHGMAISEYGIFSGAVGTLINVPASLAISFAITMIPVVARHKKERNIEGIKQGEMSALKAVLMIALPSTVALFVVAKPLMGFLYPRFTLEEQTQAVFLLRISVLQIPIISVLQLYGAYLQALDKGVISARNMLIAGIVKLAVNFSAIKIGIIGIVIANTLCYVVCAALDIYYGRVLSGKNQFKGGLGIVLSTAAMGVVMAIILNKISNKILSFALSVLIGGLIYVIILLCYNKINRKFGKQHQ